MYVRMLHRGEAACWSTLLLPTFRAILHASAIFTIVIIVCFLSVSYMNWPRPSGRTGNMIETDQLKSIASPDNSGFGLET